MGAFQQFHQYWTSKEAHSCMQQTNKKTKKKEGGNKSGTSPVRKFNNNDVTNAAMYKLLKSSVFLLRTQAYILKEKERWN